MSQNIITITLPDEEFEHMEQAKMYFGGRSKYLVWCIKMQKEAADIAAKNSTKQR